MRLSLLALALASATIPGAYAMPKAQGSKKSVNRVLTGSIASSLFTTLDLPLREKQNATEKFLSLDSESLQIDCVQTVQSTTVCGIFLNGEESGSTIREIIYGSEAKTLFDSLDAPLIPGVVSDVKIFSDAEGDLSVYCSKSLLPNGNPYSCAVELVRP